MTTEQELLQQAIDYAADPRIAPPRTYAVCVLAARQAAEIAQLRAEIDNLRGNLHT